MNKSIQRKSLLLSTFTLMTTSSLLVFSSLPAQADLFCYPWERGCTVDGEIGTSGNNVGGVARDGFIIYVNNRTGTAISVDVTAYVQEPLPVGENCAANCEGWRNLGTWEFAPGEKALILNGADGIVGRYATFKARSRDGRIWEKEVDMGSHIGSFTFTFW